MNRSEAISTESPCLKSRSRRREAAYAVILPLAAILILELVLRVAAFAWHGFSPYYLFYGVHNLVGQVGISPWTLHVGGHYKFPPNYVLRDAAGQGSETASTNSLGFRGPDFEPRKPKGTFRVITLGESSTFGYHNTDTGTYPFLLEQLFREQTGSVRVEVVNAGFPYYNSASIRSLLEQELKDYEPDVLTLYAAYNDTGWPLHVGPLSRAAIWLQQHSIIYLLLKETVLTDGRVYWLQRKLSKWLPQQRPKAELLKEQAEQIAARYRRNVEGIAAFAKARGITLVVIRQPMTSLYHNRALTSYSYQQEYEAVLKKLGDGVFLSAFETWLIFHRRLIDELDAIAREHSLPVVDNIAIVDQDRTQLTTWVHLTEEANARLAKALKEVIAPFVAKSATVQTRASAAAVNTLARPTDTQGAP
jgi:lysophospholipase L1-like esterase